MRLASGAGVLDEPREGGCRALARRRVGVALLPPAPHGLDRGLLDPGVDRLDRRVEVGGERVGLGRLEPVDADDDVLTRLDRAGAVARARRRAADFM